MPVQNVVDTMLDIEITNPYRCKFVHSALCFMSKQKHASTDLADVLPWIYDYCCDKSVGTLAESRHYIDQSPSRTLGMTIFTIGAALG